MKTVRLLICGLLFFCAQGVCGLLAAAENAGSDAAQATPAVDPTVANNTAAAAAVATGHAQRAQPAQDFLEHLVDSVLGLFNVTSSGNTTIRYVISALFLVAAFLLRHVVTKILFGILKKFAARTETTLDDKLFPAMEAPVAAFISVAGFFAALKVLKLSPEADLAIGYGSTIAFSLVIFWGLLRAFNAVLDHAHEVAIEKQMGVAAFMPWIKKTLLAIFVVIGVLLAVQSLGYDVKAILGAAGIGGLAFALAAQDTIANLFGSLVVATDQPFKIGETVKVGSSTGAVEDIGLRSTKIRLTDKSLVVVPNKMMASEAIVNLSRFTQRRVEQVIGLTYDTTAEQMETILADFRALLTAEEGVTKDSVDVYFTEYAQSSLNIQIVYFTTDPDYRKHLVLRERINLKIMRTLAARGLSMAFPTQTLLHEGPLAKQLVTKKS
jgi:MscS family membrane protein